MRNNVKNIYCENNYGKLYKLNSNCWKIWKSNYFVIIFYVKTFIEKMKANYAKGRYKKLSSFHFSIIDDLGNIKDEKQNLNILDRMKLNYQEIIHASHTYHSKLIMKKMIFCKKI